jgi:hypothetical protein
MGVDQRGPKLVGEQDGHPALLDPRADDPGRRGEDELTVNVLALSDDQADELIA